MVWEDFNMKTMKIEKILEMHETVLEVMDLTVKDALTYETVEEGIRAIGPVSISGYWRSASDTYPIHETLQFDVLAPANKRSDEPFSLEAVGIHSEVLGKEISLELTFLVNGIKEETNETPVFEEAQLEVDHTNVEEERSEFEDLLEDDEATNTTYRFAIARNGDTYYDIAARYGVNESVLKELNHDKPIPFKTLVLLPLQPDQES